ncbi:uncharacterized protein DUF4907 [Flavobacterium cutihirudinis]|uniref:Uncharacterized protein DUF4907 n=1 Tax=Flavobacterium cutihirudinis TaxID=1265740 RepID=A0A3D9FQF0_9FLAO|nr:DUF4907 domain-containing protein [Flavobacterium cutihirudinis]RED21938.1 uncharacterized protein DUF4907 [Flavobacterium cutihirudinis]
MMIINNSKFFWSKIQKNLLFFVLVSLFIGCTKKETLQMDSFRTTSGWGYTIAYKDKILIKQSVIPVITDNKSFESKEDALKVGNLVIQKLNEHSSPTVTKNDLILLKIKF